MSSDARLRRWRTRLRFATADRYRRLLASDSSTLGFRAVLLAAAVFDRSAAVARRVRLIRSQGLSVHARMAQLRAGRRGLTVISVATALPDQLSLCLNGPAAALRAATTVRLTSCEPSGEPIDLRTIVTSADGVVRIAAALPLQHFAAAGARWRLAVTDGSSELDYAVARSALAGVATAPAPTWPPHPAVDAERRLVLSGTASAGAGLDHRVIVGVRTATVTWTSTAAADLQLRMRDGGQTITVTGDRDAVDAGTVSAHIDLLELARSGDGLWRVSVRGADDGWLPVQVSRTEAPSLGALAAIAEVPIRRADGSVARVRLAYSGDNRLTIRVGPSR